VVELLLVLPILLALFAGMMQFSLILTARQQLLAASREGARVASHGGTEDEVKAAVQRVLGGGNLGRANSKLYTLPEDPRHPVDGRDRVAVCVCVPTTCVVPDLLAWVGVSFRNQDMVSCTIMVRE
jgi:hypothetical protein